MRIFANANYPFLRWRRQGYIAAAIFLGIGVVAIIVNILTTGSWVNYGLDFSGGTLVHVGFEEPVELDELRAVSPGWEIIQFGEPEANEYLIRTGNFEDELSEDAAAAVSSTLASAFGQDSFQVVRTEAVSARVGGELQQQALIAILLSFALTLVYLAFRFEWRFGVAALLATTHDIIFTLGFVAALRMEVSVSTVAAFLTIVGYSLNDTIVVFDRIRENLTKRRRGETFDDVIDRSMNETLPRTTLTTITTLTTLTALYLFGGSVIRDFSLVLIVGIAIGTFSSIFIAGPALSAIQARWPRTERKSTRGSTSASRRETARV